MASRLRKSKSAAKAAAGKSSPSESYHVYALSPERDHLEIRFPRVESYVRKISAEPSGDEDVVELPQYEAHRGVGSTRDVDFWTTKPVLECNRTHVTYVVANAVPWEQSAVSRLDRDSHVIAFAKNVNLGFAIPYAYKDETREYLPDFLVRLQHGGRDVGTLILETKGYDPLAMATVDGAQRWIAAVNAEGSHGRWAYRLVTAPTDLPAALKSAAQELVASPRRSWREALSRFVEEIRALYGSRLDSVVLYGSRARGDAVEGSDIDTLVVLDRCEDFWGELKRVGNAANAVLLDQAVVISAFPISRDEFNTGDRPFLQNVRREGKRVP